MNYTKQEYKKMIESFNNCSFKGKLELIRDHKDIIYFEYDNGWCILSLKDVPEDIVEEIQEEVWFDFDGEAFVSSSEMYDLFELANII